MIDLSTLEAIFFDADDTLYRVNGSVGDRYATHLIQHGHKVSPKEVNRAVPIAWRRLTGTYENHEGDHVTSHERDKAVWSEYVHYVMEELSQPKPSEKLFDAIYQEFARAESRTLQPHVQSILEKIRKLPLVTGVLTNNDRRIHQLIPDLGLADHFDHVFCASDIGYKKPSKKVFDGVSEKIGILPEKILYIGDCPKNDVEGAKAAGWQVLWYRREKHHPLKDVPTVQCFSEVVRVIEKSGRP